MKTELQFWKQVGEAMETKELWTIQEVVMLTRVSESAIRHRIKRGQLPARKIGPAVMLEKAAVDKLMRGR